MRSTYRLGYRASYMLTLALALSSCAFEPKFMPPNAVVSASIPAAWLAVAGTPGAAPTIIGARFSSLDVELGQDWDGDIVTSTEVDDVELHTNLFDIGTHRTAPGRFHFTQYVIDDPAFIVRPYALDVIATGKDGKRSTLVVPFRLRGHGVP